MLFNGPKSDFPFKLNGLVYGMPEKQIMWVLDDNLGIIFHISP